MAKKLIWSAFTQSTAASVTIDIPTNLEIGDTVIILVASSNSTTEMTAPGYTNAFPQVGAGGIRVGALRKYIATAGDALDESVVLSSASGHWSGEISVWRGISSTPTFIASVSTWTAANSNVTGTLDASAGGPNQVVQYFTAAINQIHMGIVPGTANLTSRSVGSVSAFAAHKIMPVAGVSNDLTFYSSMRSGNGQSFLLAIPDDGLGYNEQDVTTSPTLMSGGATFSRSIEGYPIEGPTFSVTGVASTDVFTVTGHTPVNGDEFIFTSLTGGAGLTPLTIRYFMINVVGQTFQASREKGGSTAVLFSADLTAGTIQISNMLREATHVLAPTIGGVSTDTQTSRLSYSGISNQIQSNLTTQAGKWIGAIDSITAPVNLVGKSILIYWGCDTSPTFIGSGGFIYVISDGSNWASYALSGKGCYVPTERLCSVIHPGTSTVYDSSGSVNLSAITKVGLLHHRESTASGNTVTIATGTVLAVDKQIIIGGGPLSPATLSGLNVAYDELLPGFVRSLGTNLGLIRVDTQIGDGVNKTVFGVANSGIPVAIETPPPFVRTSRSNRLDNTNGGAVNISIKSSATDSINLTNLLLSSTNSHTFGFDAASNVDATIECSDASFIGIGEWTGKTGLDRSFINFVKCKKISGAGAIYDSCNFKNGKSSDAAISISSGGGVPRSIFTRGIESYAIEVPDEVGDTTLDITSATFIGAYTKHINILKTTGTVTISTATNQTFTYDTSGATVVVVQPPIYITFTNADLINGTSILVRNVTTNTTLDYVSNLSTGNGYTITMLLNTDFYVDDLIEVRMSRKNGTSYYEPRTYSIFTSDTSGEFIDKGDLSLCNVCTNLGLDGMDYITIFDIDEANNEMDLITGGSFMLAQLMVWWEYQMTLQAPMESYWGAWVVEDDGSFKNNVSVISGYLDNNTPIDSVESSGRRVYRSDNVRPIRSPTSGGGAIDVSWREPVSIAEVGVSGLTASESITLAKIDLINNRLPAAPADQPLIISAISSTQTAITNAIDLLPTEQEITLDIDNNSAKLLHISNIVTSLPGLLH